MIDAVAEDITYRMHVKQCGHPKCRERTLYTNADQFRASGWVAFSRGWRTYASGLTKEEFLYLCPTHNRERGPSIVEATPGRSLRTDVAPKWDCVLGPDEWGI